MKLRLIKFDPSPKLRKDPTRLVKLYTYVAAEHAFALSVAKYRQQMPMALEKIYRRFDIKTRRDKDAALVIISCFFTRFSRGSNLTGQCSTWTPRPAGQVRVADRLRQYALDLCRQNHEWLRQARIDIKGSPDDPLEVLLVVPFASLTEHQVAMFRLVMESQSAAELKEAA